VLGSKKAKGNRAAEPFAMPSSRAIIAAFSDVFPFKIDAGERSQMLYALRQSDFPFTSLLLAFHLPFQPTVEFRVCSLLSPAVSSPVGSAQI
jgi:hypothetical protein